MDFYCDASSHRGHDYMVAGGLVIREERYHEIEEKIQAIKDAAGIKSEMKWTKYKGGERRAAYEGLVDLAFLLVKEKQAALHVIVVHFASFKHAEGRDTSVNRMYYQLAVHRLCNFYGKSCAMHIYPDIGDDSADLLGFRNHMCASGFSKYGTKPNCIRAIKPQCSKAHGVMQMADVLVGAMAAKLNGRATSAHKLALADYVLEKSGHSSWTADRGWPTWLKLGSKFFTVWNFKPKRAIPSS